MSFLYSQSATLESTINATRAQELVITHHLCFCSAEMGVGLSICSQKRRASSPKRIGVSLIGLAIVLFFGLVIFANLCAKIVTIFELTKCKVHFSWFWCFPVVSDVFCV